MNKERMLAIADYIENADSEQFNMSAWFGKALPKYQYKDLELEDWDVDEDLQLIDGYDLWDYDHIHHFVDGYSLNKLECGTTACIAGWTNVYMFKKEQDYNDILEEHKVTPYVIGHSAVAEIAAEYLGLTPAEADWIFFTNQFSVWMQYKEEYGFKDTVLVNSSTGINISNKQAADVLRRIANGEIVYKPEFD